MKSTDGSTGYRQEQTGEQRILSHVARITQPSRVGIAVAVIEIAPELGQLRHLRKQTDHQRYGHEQQGKGKDRIKLADDLVDRQHSGQNIVGKDHDHP